MSAIKYALFGLLGIIGMLISMFGPVRIPFAESVAKSYYRYALAALLVILLLIIAAASLFLLVFNANNFKSEIIQFVKERTQRELVLQGDIKVTFFPKLGLDSGRMSLTQRNSAKEFASINNARLYIAWLPLLKRQLVFDHVVIDGIHANVIRLKDGSTNFDDLLIKDEHLAPLSFDIDSVRITDSSINWQDELESQRAVLHHLQLETGRLADTVPSNLTASFQLDSERAHVKSTVQLQSRLFFDRKSGRYEFADIEGHLAGESGQFSNLMINFKGNIDSYPAHGAIKLDDLIVAVTGKYGHRNIEAKLSASSLDVQNHQFSGTQLAIDANSFQLNETSAFVMHIPVFASTNKLFKANDVSVDFDVNDNQLSLHGKLASPLSITFGTAPKFNLAAIALSLNCSHPVLSGDISADLTGNVLVDYAGENANFSFDAKLDENKIKVDVALKDFSRPVYTIDISTNRLDLNRYLSSEWLNHVLDDEAVINTAGLKETMLQGSFHAGEIILNNFKVSRFAADLKIKQSLISISPLSGHLYGGSTDGGIYLTAHEAPSITVRQTLKDVQMDALLADTNSAGRFIGKACINLDVSSQGGSIAALRNTLNGNLALTLNRGSFAGIDLNSALREGKGDLGAADAAHTHPADFSLKTVFSDLRADFTFNEGRIVKSHIDMKSPFIRTTGEGVIDPSSLNYRFNSAVSNSLKSRTGGELFKMKGITVPIQVTGTYSSPIFALDFAAASGISAAKSATSTTASTRAASLPAKIRPQQKGVSRPAADKSKASDAKSVKKLQQ